MTNRRRSQILLVDDDASTIQLLGHILAQEGEIRFTTSGTEALRMVDETPPNLILLDIDMPEKNGLEICRTLQANPRLVQVPIIILTSHAQAATEVWALEVGAADFIAKPLIASQVLARVRSQLRRLEGGGAPGEEAPDPQAGPRGTRILIVDDDAGAIQCIRLALGTSAEQFQFATSGEEALRAVAKAPPDLILLDAQMPGIDGFEVCRRLQDNPAFSHVPIVFVTRFSDPASEARAMDLGASDFIGKPYKPAVLKARVRNILRRKVQAHATFKAQQAHWQRLSDKRVSAIVDEASDAILTADAEGHLVQINKAACAMFQLTPEQALGRPLRSVLNWQPATPEAAAGYCGMKTFLRPDGASVTAEASTSQTGQGGDLLTTIVLRDLAERHRADTAQRARTETETASRTKNLLLSYIAHEIGNPLNDILGLAQLILADRTHPLLPVQAMRVCHILHSGQHLQSLMRDVLDLSRFEAGTLEVHAEEVDIGACVREAVRLLQADATAAEVRLSGQTPDEPVKARGDRARLLQCLLNLLSNGIKFNRPQGRVEVGVESFDEQVRITVSDSGMGMSPAQVQHLFEPFNRLGRDASVHGAGIGLAVTHHLIQAMGGRIEADSTVGAGSRFIVSLPMWAPVTSAPTS